jgi:hypothetical protein
MACKANLATRLQSPLPCIRAKVYLEFEAVDRILAQQVCCESQKNKVENNPHAEIVAAAAAMPALKNRTHAGDWHHTSSAKVMIGKQQRQGWRGRAREREGGNNREGQQQQCLSSSNQVVIKKH